MDLVLLAKAVGLSASWPRPAARAPLPPSSSQPLPCPWPSARRPSCALARSPRVVLAVPRQ
eukprot:6715311-Pyramimonas_sp.AAC.1